MILPLGLLGAEFGDVVLGLTDEAALPGAHPGDSKRVFSKSGAAPFGGFPL